MTGPWRKRLIIGGGLAFIGLAVTFALWVTATRSSEAEVRKIAREAGIPLTAEELYPPYKGDPQDNAATYVPRLMEIERQLDPNKTRK